MKVGFAIWQNENGADGGVESITQIIERLRRARAVVITQRETARTARWRSAGADVHVLPRAYEAWTEDALGIRYLPINNAWIAALVRRERIRVLHCNDLRAFLNVGPGARAAGARLIFNVRDVKPAGQAYRATWRVAAELSETVLALSNEMAADLRERLRGLFGAPDVDFVYSAVDPGAMYVPSPERRAALRRALGFAERDFVVAYVAACNPKKAQLPFLERAVPLLAEAVPHAVVAFVGDFRAGSDGYADRCAAVAEPHVRAGRVRFVGYTPHIGDWYRAADVVALASRNEGLARCMIEGLACGTPVVSFDVCSAREILEAHGCGVVVPQGDYAGFVEALARLADAPETAARLGARGAALARQLFDPVRQAARYEDLYERLAREVRVA